ncbi:type II toxin-antitoxin system death-on-curing family toxin [uncultured Sphingomonas sp.]|uniref:type II toxin-antitoxin system death-on-curing family toxin n=1 Tax=uncultured Sphingomonas sp. TaxID=158754 RepID=UPI0035CA53EF
MTANDVEMIHDRQLRAFGGLAGVKDPNLLHSAVAAPRNLFLYDEEEDVLALSVKLCFALAMNHPFVDGNKRTATSSMVEFLARNGLELLVPDDEAETPLLGQWIEKLVRGDLTSDQLLDRLEPFVQSTTD